VYCWWKNRHFHRIATFALLGLAVCVFAWGLQYKLSLYDPPQAASRQVPMAKLLSQNEQSWATESPLIVRTRTAARVIYPASIAAFLGGLGLGTVTLQVLNQREQQANRSWPMRRRFFLNNLFVRPPPILV
jgi:hypothetical protein